MGGVRDRPRGEFGGEWVGGGREVVREAVVADKVGATGEARVGGSVAAGADWRGWIEASTRARASMHGAARRGNESVPERSPFGASSDRRSERHLQTNPCSVHSAAPTPCLSLTPPNHKPFPLPFSGAYACCLDHVVLVLLLLLRVWASVPEARYA